MRFRSEISLQQSLRSTPAPAGNERLRVPTFRDGQVRTQPAAVPFSRSSEGAYPGAAVAGVVGDNLVSVIPGCDQTNIHRLGPERIQWHNGRGDVRQEPGNPQGRLVDHLVESQLRQLIEVHVRATGCSERPY